MRLKKVDWEEGASILYHFDADTVYITGNKTSNGKKTGKFMIKRSPTKTLQSYTNPDTFHTSMVMCHTYTIFRTRNGKINHSVHHAP